MRIIRDAGRRAAVPTRQLLAFGRRQALNIAQIDLNTVIGGTLELLKSALGSRISVDVAPCEALWPTRGDVGQLEQARVGLRRPELHRLHGGQPGPRGLRVRRHGAGPRARQPAVA